jgi:hypothetical protein
MDWNLGCMSHILIAINTTAERWVVLRAADYLQQNRHRDLLHSSCHFKKYQKSMTYKVDFHNLKHKLCNCDASSIYTTLYSRLKVKSLQDLCTRADFIDIPDHHPHTVNPARVNV